MIESILLPVIVLQFNLPTWETTQHENLDIGFPCRSLCLCRRSYLSLSSISEMRIDFCCYRIAIYVCIYSLVDQRQGGSRWYLAVSPRNRVSRDHRYQSSSESRYCVGACTFLVHGLSPSDWQTLAIICEVGTRLKSHPFRKKKKERMCLGTNGDAKWGPNSSGGGEQKVKTRPLPGTEYVYVSSYVWMYCSRYLQERIMTSDVVRA